MAISDIMQENIKLLNDIALDLTAILPLINTAISKMLWLE